MLPKRLLRISMPLLIALAVEGCVFAPGQSVLVDEGLTTWGDQAGTEVILQPLTQTVVADAQRQLKVQVLSPEALNDLQIYRAKDYRLMPGDAVNVVVWEHPELTTPAGSLNSNNLANNRLVRDDGTLYFPYVGLIQAAGLTVPEFRAQLSAKLARYIQAPQVDVVVNYGRQRIFLSGAFRQATPLTITDAGLTLADALGNGGVDTATADLAGLTLQRDGKVYALNLDQLAQNQVPLASIPLKHGDQLHLPFLERKKVFVMGEVNRAAAVPFRLGYISLADALMAGGGIRQETSSAGQVYVIRERGEASPGVLRTVDVYQLDADDARSLAFSDRFPLQAGDIVFVSTAAITRWNRFISQLLPTTALLRTSQQINNAP